MRFFSCNDNKKNRDSASSAKPSESKEPKTSEKKDVKEEEKDPESLKPRSMMPQNQEEIEAVAKIRQGKVRAARDNETVEDAQSDWGAVKSMDEKVKEESEGAKKRKKK
uniref:Uncharacterized protein n=1 Tax=Panagrolaimus sp. JU765 TaxID=591449 RepID=A0AC34R343_9BILA